MDNLIFVINSVENYRKKKQKKNKKKKKTQHKELPTANCKIISIYA